MIIATCSYARFRPDMGVPVRLTNSVPGGLPYTVRHSATELAPTPDMARLSFDEFRSAYLRHLDAYGFEQAGRLLRGILLTERADLDTTAAVLLTATDLARPGAWCHRTVLAGWITANGGGLVADLGHLDEAGTPAMF